MSRITEVADAVEAEFKKLWQYQSEHEFVRADVLEADLVRTERLSKIAATPPSERTPEDVKELHDALDAGEKLQSKQNEQKSAYKRCNLAVAERLNQLTPSTFDKDDAKAPEELYEFLTRFSKSYTQAGKQRSAAPLLEYLLACDYPHAFWLWRQWIAACLAVGDHESADRLIGAATDGSTPASHQFATRGGAWKPAFSVAKAQIFLLRDGDLDKAREVVENARLQFSGSIEVTEARKALGYLARKVEKGELSLEMKRGADKRFQLEDQEKVEEAFSPRFLIEMRT